jgi:hypothetical protein
MLLGGLVPFGVSLRLALLGGSLLICLSHSDLRFIQDWNAAVLQLVYAMVYAGLLAFRTKDCLSVDFLRHIADLSSASQCDLQSRGETLK